MKIFDTQKNNGFTIIETLVAVAILMISIAGPLTIAHKGLLTAIQTKDQVTASYLAQDAMEYVKNLRDNNKMAIPPRPWLTGIRTCDSKDNRCSVDTLNGSIGNSCGDCKLRKDDTIGYQHSSGANTQFSRYFYITPNLTNPAEATLVVEVEWKSGTINNLVSYKSEIFDVLK